MNNYNESAVAPTRVLIVEDNKAISEAIRLLLVGEGFETKWCDDDTVYGLVSNWHPDVILMDLKMPHLDGCVASHAIKSDPATCSIPVIILTSEQITPERFRNTQANELLPKPFGVKRLLESIRYWVSVRSRIPGAFGTTLPRIA